MGWVAAVAVVGAYISVVRLFSSHRRQMIPPQMADLVERFLDGKSRYPQEWNDFVDTFQIDKKLDLYRRQCDMLDSRINKPGGPDADALAQARAIVSDLRHMD